MTRAKKDKKNLIIVMGAGAVGNRAADVLLSLNDYRVAMVKHGGGYLTPSGHVSEAKGLGEDINSVELKRLVDEWHKDKDVPILAARGGHLDERITAINKVMGRCDGSIDSFLDEHQDEVALVIDASPGRTRGTDLRNYLEIYDPRNLPFVLNGGGDSRLANHRFFASVPHPAVDEYLKDNRDKKAMIVSCNTHAVTTALAITAHVLRKLDTPTDLRKVLRDHVDIIYNRRHDDPHKKRRRPAFVSVEQKPYHVDEVESIIPEVAGNVSTTYSKWPTEYFHTVTVTLDFKAKVSDALVDDLRMAFLRYRRTILVEGEISHEKTINAAHWARIQDGDIPYPVVMVDRVGNYKIRYTILTPQRGIVANSTADYVHLRTQPDRFKTRDEAAKFTDDKGRYRLETATHLANAVQYNLIAENYKRLHREHGPSPVIAAKK